MRSDKISEREIRRILDDILKRREFNQNGNSNSVFKLVSDIWESIQEWVREFFDYSQPNREIRVYSGLNSSSFQTVAKVLLVLTASVLLFLLVRLITKRLYMSKKIKFAEFPRVSDYLSRPEDALNKYSECMTAKEYSKALRFLFIALLLELDRRKIIKIAKWKTNRMYLREIRLKDETLAVSVQEFVNLFDECCYGNRNIDEASVSRWFEFYALQKEKPV